MSDRRRDEATGPAHRADRRPRRALRPGLLGLEDRALMATLAPIGTVFSPAGLGYQLPLDGGNDGAQSFVARSDNPNIVVKPAQGQFWSVGVSHESSGPNDPAFTGTLTFQLFGDLTPLTVSKITQLIQSGFYTSPTEPPSGSSVPQFPSKNFHRIVPGFVAQGGSQSGNGAGAFEAPGFPFADEFRQQLVFNGVNQLAMANSGDDTNDTQFFVTYNSPRNLDYNHTIFGQLVSGQQTLTLMENVARPNSGADTSTPIKPILITSSTLSDTNPDGVLHIDTTQAQVGETANVAVTAAMADGSTLTRTFQVNVTANLDSNGQPINEPAFLNPIPNYVVAKGQTAIFLATATNPEPNEPLTYVVNGGTRVTSTGKSFLPVQNATASVDENGVVTVVPNANFTGVIDLQVGVRDNVPHSGRPTNLNDPDAFDTQTLTLTVRDGEVVNLQPIAVPGSQTISANQPTTVQLPGLTANPASDQTLTYTLLQGPKNGTLTNFDPNTGTFLYTPNNDFLGPDTVTFRVTDIGAPGPSLTSEPAVFTLDVGGADTGAVRLVNGVLIVTPPPRTDGGTNTVLVNLIGDTYQIKVNNLIDQTQPTLNDVDRLVVYGTKASDQVFVGDEVTVPSWISGGLGGSNRLQAGGGMTRLHGWFGFNRMRGGPADDWLYGRDGHVRFRISDGRNLYFTGQARPGRRGGGMYSPSFKFSAVPQPPTGTFYRQVNNHIVPIGTPSTAVRRFGHPLVGAGHDPNPAPPTPGIPVPTTPTPGTTTPITGGQGTPITIPGLTG